MQRESHPGTSEKNFQKQKMKISEHSEERMKITIIKNQEKKGRKNLSKSAKEIFRLMKVERNFSWKTRNIRIIQKSSPS